MVILGAFGFICLVAFGFTCAIIARSRGRNALVWFALGFLFAIFALIVVLVLPRLEPQPRPELVSPGRRRRFKP